MFLLAEHNYSSVFKSKQCQHHHKQNKKKIIFKLYEIWLAVRERVRKYIHRFDNSRIFFVTFFLHCFFVWNLIHSMMTVVVMIDILFLVISISFFLLQPFFFSRSWWPFFLIYLFIVGYVVTSLCDESF
mgnify:CR=1 FL=1